MTADKREQTVESLIFRPISMDIIDFLVSDIGFPRSQAIRMEFVRL